MRGPANAYVRCRFTLHRPPHRSSCASNHADHPYPCNATPLSTRTGVKINMVAIFKYDIIIKECTSRTDLLTTCTGGQGQITTAIIGKWLSHSEQPISLPSTSLATIYLPSSSCSRAAPWLPFGELGPSPRCGQALNGWRLRASTLLLPHVSTAQCPPEVASSPRAAHWTAARCEVFGATPAGECRSAPTSARSLATTDTCVLGMLGPQACAKVHLDRMP